MTYHGEDGDRQGNQRKAEHDKGDRFELNALLHQQGEDGATHHDANLRAHKRKRPVSQELDERRLLKDVPIRCIP
jgi:hypothetical protein